MYKLNKRNYKIINNFQTIVTISNKDIIATKQINNNIVIIAYFDNVPQNRFLVNRFNDGIIIRVNRNIPKEKVMYELISYLKGVNNGNYRGNRYKCK